MLLHAPGLVAVVVASAVVILFSDRMSVGVAVALFVAATGAGALAGGLRAALTAATAALLAWRLLDVPFDALVVGAFAVGVVLLGVAGEMLRRSWERAGALAAELERTQQRLAGEAEVRSAERAEAALRRLAEEREGRALLDVIFDNAPVGLGVYDRDLRFLRLNRRLAEINGLPPEQQLGRRVPDVLPELGTDVVDAFAHVLRTGEAIERLETRGRTPAAPDDRVWEVSCYPVPTGDGTGSGVAAVVFEVTDRRRAEAEREGLLHAAERARADAESASRAKDEFLAVLSHELRAPLQGVLGWVSLLRDGRLDVAQQARALQAIERSTRMQTQLINDLLDVSRIISGRLTLESHPFDLSAAVHDAVDELRPTAEARGITLDASIVDCGVLVGDPARMHQVLGNLLSNAIKFTPSGGTITVRCEREHGEIVLTVEDTGEGIAAEFLPHVFERFRQADSSSARRHGGLGLGLAIARRLVELHDGRIGAESAGVGRGARFVVRLPARDADCPVEPAAPPEPVDVLRGRRVLVVDDDVDSREAIVLALTLEGALVTSAGSADDALRLLATRPPELIVSDLSMPGADGHALLASLRAHGVHAPAIAVTGLVTPEDRAHAHAAGFAAHIAKPVDVAVLLRTVVELLTS